MIAIYRRLLDLMTPHERGRFWLVVVVTFFLSAIEAASVILILPFLQLLSEPEMIETNAILSRAYDIGGFSSTRSFLIAAGVAVFAITVFGLLMKIVTIWMTTRFALMRTYSFGARLLTQYLYQPYEWFLDRHTADMEQAILAEIHRVIWEVLLPAMRFIPELFTVALLVLMLCVLEPEIAIGGSVVLGVAYGMIYLAVRRLLHRSGLVQVAANKVRYRVIQEATGGLKDVKILGLEHRFLHNFRVATLRFARVQTKGQIAMNTPRYALEAFAFGGMILLILLLLLRDDGDLSKIVPTLGLIAAVCLRLIPAMQQLYHRIGMLRQAEASLDRVYTDMVGLDLEHFHRRGADTAQAPVPLTETLELRGVSYAYPNSGKPSLDGLDLDIKARTTVGIVGSTGAGKTTLIDIILGLLEPQEGTILVDGTALTDETIRGWQSNLGYVPQSIFLTDGTIAQNIAFGVADEDIDMAAVERAARIAALHDFVLSELEHGYDTEVGQRGIRLSGGQRQRIGIARALYRDPAVLILDEATSALDNLTEAAIMEAVRNVAGDKTVIMIAHRLSTVRECDRIFMMRNGRVANAGTFAELIDADAEFRAMAEGVTPTARTP